MKNVGGELTKFLDDTRAVIDATAGIFTMRNCWKAVNNWYLDSFSHGDSVYRMDT